MRIWQLLAVSMPGLAVAVVRSAGPAVEEVVRCAHRVTDDDVAALVRAGYSEDERFEAIIVAAAGAADRRLQAARGAMAEA